MAAKREAVVSIRWIVTLVAVALTASAVLCAGAIGERSTRETLSSEIEMRIVVDARMLANASTSAMLGDFPELTLHPLARQMRARQPELVAILVVDRAGVIQGHEDPRLLGTKYASARELKPLTPQNALASGEGLWSDGKILLASCAVRHPNGQPMGTAYVGVRRDYVDRVLATARRKQLLVLGLFLAGGVLIASVLMSQLLKPIAVLRKGIERIGQGDLETPLRLTDHTELRLLGSAINDMASQLRQAQRRLLDQNRELSVANENLKDLDRLKSEFLRNVNHELRTPLTVIIAYLSYLQERKGGPVDEAVLRESIDVTLQESWKLKRLLEDLLEFSALTGDSLELHLESGNLKEILTSYYAERRAGIAQGNRELVLDASCDVPETVYDRQRLMGALDSILDNAVKFTPTGTRITLRLGTGLEGEEEQVWIQLEDNGPGVPPEHLPNLFTPFRQLDGSTTREIGGLGLGLALTKEMVERMGGTIAVSSEVGRGTVFTLRFPAVAQDERRGAA